MHQPTAVRVRGPRAVQISGCGVMRTYTCPDTKGLVSYGSAPCTFVNGDADAQQGPKAEPSPVDESAPPDAEPTPSSDDSSSESSSSSSDSSASSSSSSDDGLDGSDISSESSSESKGSSKKPAARPRPAAASSSATERGSVGAAPWVGTFALARVAWIAHGKGAMKALEHAAHARADHRLRDRQLPARSRDRQPREHRAAQPPQDHRRDRPSSSTSPTWASTRRACSVAGQPARPHRRPHAPRRRGLTEQIARAVGYRAAAVRPGRATWSGARRSWSRPSRISRDLRDQLALDVQAAFDGDPAAKSIEEIVLQLPGVHAITVYRFAHELHARGVPMVPRIMAEYAHGQTGIDIHPGAADRQALLHRPRHRRRHRRDRA